MESVSVKESSSHVRAMPMATTTSNDKRNASTDGCSINAAASDESSLLIRRDAKRRRMDNGDVDGDGDGDKGASSCSNKAKTTTSTMTMTMQSRENKRAYLEDLLQERMLSRQICHAGRVHYSTPRMRVSKNVPAVDVEDMVGIDIVYTEKREDSKDVDVRAEVEMACPADLTVMKQMLLQHHDNNNSNNNKDHDSKDNNDNGKDKTRWSWNWGEEDIQHVVTQIPPNAQTVQTLRFLAGNAFRTTLENTNINDNDDLLLRVLKQCTSLQELHLHVPLQIRTTHNTNHNQANTRLNIPATYLQKILTTAPHLTQTLTVLSFTGVLLDLDAVETLGNFSSLVRLDIPEALDPSHYHDNSLYFEDYNAEDEGCPYDQPLFECVEKLECLERLDLGFGGASFWLDVNQDQEEEEEEEEEEKEKELDGGAGDGTEKDQSNNTNDNNDQTTRQTVLEKYCLSLDGLDSIEDELFQRSNTNHNHNHNHNHNQNKARVTTDAQRMPQPWTTDADRETARDAVLQEIENDNHQDKEVRDLARVARLVHRAAAGGLRGVGGMNMGGVGVVPGVSSSGAGAGIPVDGSCVIS